MTYDYNKLRGRIVEKYGSYSVFANKLGVPKQTVSAKLCGKIQFSQEDISAWSKVLDLSLSEARVYFFHPVS